jgi:hypothetical protein
MVGLNQVMQSNGVYTVGYFLVEFTPCMPGNTIFLARTGLGAYTIDEFQGTFHGSEYISYSDLVYWFAGNVTPLGAPDTPDNTRFSQGDEELFQVTIGKTGVFRNGSGTGIFSLGKQDHIQQRFQGIPAFSRNSHTYPSLPQ